MTLGQPKSAQASITLVYRSTNSSWYLGLLNPVLNEPGIVFDEMAQVRPYFLRVGKSSGATSSTDATPKPLAASQVWSSDHFSPADMKHQATTDCLTFPFTTAFPGVSAAAIPAAARAPAASASRRVNWFDMAAPGEWGTARECNPRRRAGLRGHSDFGASGSTSFRNTSHCPIPTEMNTVPLAWLTRATLPDLPNLGEYTWSPG